MTDLTCAVPGCNQPRHITRTGAVRTYCTAHTQAYNRKRNQSALPPEERNCRAALGLLLDHEWATVTNAPSSGTATNVHPSTAHSLVRRGFAEFDADRNRVRITTVGRIYLSAVIATSPERDLRPDPDYTPPAPDVPEVSSLAAAARALPPLPVGPAPSLAHELALLARLKDTLRTVDLAALASVPQAAPLVPVLRQLERAG
jgi:hypothetical protein